MAITAVLWTIGWLLGSMVLTGGGPAATPAPQAPALAAAAPAEAALVNRKQAEAAGLTVYWQRSLPLEEGDRPSRIVRLDENLYVITQRNHVLTLDAATGVFRWSTHPAEEGIRLLGPTHGPDQVYFGTVVGIQSFDRVNGDRRLDWQDPIAPSSPVTSDGQELFYGSINSRVVSVRQRDVLMSWEFATDGLVTAEPILQGPNLYVVSQTGQVTAALKHNKTRIWQAQTTGPVQAPPALEGGHLYVASMDQSLWCFDLVTGRTVWRTRMSYPLPDGPHATAKHVYLPVFDHGVLSIDPDSGKIAWHQQDAAAFLAETEDLAWLASLKSSLLGCDKVSGEIRREVPMSAVLYCSNAQDDAIWMADCDGQVICLRPQGAGFLRYRKAYEAIGRATMPTTRPASRPASEGLVPIPPPKPPVDYLRRNEAIPPVGGNTPATQPSDGQ